MDTPLFSIITPTFNRAASFLETCLLSISSQQENGFSHEHIIVDDVSTDGTEELVRRWQDKDSRIRYVRSHANVGPAAALNIGFNIAKGEWIVPLDDDDFLPLQSLQIRADAAREDVDWSFGYALQVDENNAIIKGLYEGIPLFDPDPQAMFHILLRDNIITNGVVTARSRCVREVGGWDETVASQDWDMWLKLSYAGYRHILLKNYVSFYRIHQQRLSRAHEHDGTWKKDGEYFRKLYAETESGRMRSK